MTLFPVDSREEPIAYLRFLEFDAWPAALDCLKTIVEAALRHDQEPSLLLDERKITLWLRWPGADEVQEPAITFTEEVDRAWADLRPRRPDDET